LPAFAIPPLGLYDFEGAAAEIFSLIDTFLLLNFRGSRMRDMNRVLIFLGHETPEDGKALVYRTSRANQTFVLFSRISDSVPPPSRRMERAAHVIKSSKISRGILTEDDLARAIWPASVGKAIASHTVRVRVVRTLLVVEMADATWQRQLYPLTSQILERIRKLTGSEAIQGIEFRVAIPRRQPQRADAPDGVASHLVSSADESDQISDPVLRRVYRISRRKATA
jgi:hypothetical protein